MNSIPAWILVYAACIAVTLLLWPYIQAAFGPDTTPYTESGPYGGRVDRGPGGYSPYYPGRR